MLINMNQGKIIKCSLHYNPPAKRFKIPGQARDDGVGGVKLKIPAHKK